VNSPVPALEEPAEPSCAAIVTPTNAPFSSAEMAPIQGPPRTMCMWFDPSGYSNEGAAEEKLLPMKP
jgi:hypothetical protein